MDAFLHDLRRCVEVLSLYVAAGAASFLVWRLVQAIVPHWRDAYGPLREVTRAERRSLYVVRVLTLGQTLIGAGAIASILFAPVGLPLMLWSWRGWLDAGRLLRRRTIRGAYLEIGCYVLVILIMGTLVGAALTLHDDAIERANVVGALFFVPAGAAVIASCWRVARLAARRTMVPTTAVPAERQPGWVLPRFCGRTHPGSRGSRLSRAG